eukprot:gene27029-35738_t
MISQFMNLSTFKGSHINRVSAITDATVSYRLKILEKPCKRNTVRDIAVIMSHLSAMHTAIVYSNTSSRYSISMLDEFALIVEDDVRFLYEVDFQGLISTAPRPFGILQLSTSNVEAIKSLWGKYKRLHTSVSQNVSTNLQSSLWQRNRWNDLTKNKRYPLYWSAQAYIVNRTHLRGVLDDIIQENPHNGSLEFKIVNSFFPGGCKRTKARPCVLAQCLFSDTYIYSAGDPTYVHTLPLIGSSRVGDTSTIHQDQVGQHRDGFDAIDRVTHELNNPTVNISLPFYLTAIRPSSQLA